VGYSRTVLDLENILRYQSAIPKVCYSESPLFRKSTLQIRTTDSAGVCVTVRVGVRVRVRIRVSLVRN